MKSFCTWVCVARFIHVEERSLGRGEGDWDATECRDYLEMTALTWLSVLPICLSMLLTQAREELSRPASLTKQIDGQTRDTAGQLESGQTPKSRRNWHAPKQAHWGWQMAWARHSNGNVCVHPSGCYCFLSPQEFINPVPMSAENDLQLKTLSHCAEATWMHEWINPCSKLIEISRKHSLHQLGLCC